MIRQTCVLFVLLLASGADSNDSELRLSAVTWNVNGAAKFDTSFPDREYVGDFDVILLQETYVLSPENGLDLPGFIPFHTLGKTTGHKPHWGLSTLLKIESFVGGALLRIPSPYDWIQITRWRPPSDKGILLINIYVPVHTKGFVRADIDSALDFLGQLRADFPADSLILGGDFNVDHWRLSDQRRNGDVIQHKTRYIKFFKDYRCFCASFTGDTL
jgi:exonuclease III